MRTYSKALQRKLRISISGIISVILAVTLVLCTLLYQPKIAYADETGTIYVHMYEANNDYSGVYLWSWVKGASGVASPLSATAAADEQYFNKDADPNNKAHTFKRDLSAAELKALKSGTDFGILVCAGSGEWSWNNYSKETVDVYTDVSTVFDENNVAHVYYMRKDTIAYNNLEEALQQFNKIVSGSFVSVSGKAVNVSFETTIQLDKTINAALLADGELATEVESVAVTPVGGETSTTGTATFTLKDDFDLSKNYTVKIDTITDARSLDKTRLIDTAEFIATFETKDVQEAKLGSHYNSESGVTDFLLWAPFATQVNLNVFSAGDGDCLINSFPMTKVIDTVTKKWAGLWEYSGERLLNRYYTYSVFNYGTETEACDPYAVTTGVNGDRAMVIDMDAESPDGWEDDTFIYNTNPTTADVPIIWELHVRDFSSSPDSGMAYKGKYLAFTEENTTVPGTDLKTGVNYLKDLGITYVHLNPVYDYATVDESSLNRADATKDAFNWGYDPLNYNVPEGSYSTDPFDGRSRVVEFKQMVQSLHNAGIGVIMDVVYNHTYAVNGQALNDTAPGYYHRTNDEGVFTDGSGCGNETASERTLMRKYISDSLVHWASEYHIDGFRFDLMGLHDTQTLKVARESLDSLDSGKGTKILVYGEPWSADGTYTPPSYAKRTTVTSSGYAPKGRFDSNLGTQLVKIIKSGNNVTALPDRVAVFNDSMRDGIRGSNDPGQGFVNGASNPDNLGKVQKGLEGGAGTTGIGLYTGNAARNVAYAAAHDNYTLYDQMLGSQMGKETNLNYNLHNGVATSRNKVANALVMSASGMSFMLAGEEMCRTKYGNHNSYNSPDKVNQIMWSRQANFKDVYNHYKAMIALRKSMGSTFFSYSKSTNGDYGKGNFTGSGNGLISFTRTEGNKNIYSWFNSSGSDVQISAPSGELVVYNGEGYVGVKAGTTTAGGAMTLYNNSALVIVVRG